MIKNFLFPFQVFVAALLFSMLATRPAIAGEVILQDNFLRIAFDSDSGALTRMEAKTTDGNTDWTLERRPELGVSFRMFAPLPNRRFNPILGQKQHADYVKKISDHEVEIQWKNLESENGGVLPMTFTANVTLNNGVVTFKSSLQNDSSLPVETIDYPYFGDFNPPSRDSSLTACTMKSGRLRNMQQEEIYPHFANRKGYWGVFYPTKTMDDWNSVFCLIQAPDRGLYIQMDTPKPRYRLEYTFEQHPGLISGITQLVPPEDEISGTPVHLEFRTCHFIFASAHSTTQLTPIALRCYSGGMQEGEDLYRQWRANP